VLLVDALVVAVVFSTLSLMFYFNVVAPSCFSTAAELLGL